MSTLFDIKCLDVVYPVIRICSVYFISALNLYNNNELIYHQL